MAVIRNPDKGITKPWVIPQADWTTTKSENYSFQEHALKDWALERKFSPVYVMFGDPFCLI